MQVTNYISNYIWSLSYQFFFLVFTPPPAHTHTHPRMVTVRAVHILLECILVIQIVLLCTMAINDNFHLRVEVCMNQCIYLKTNAI